MKILIIEDEPAIARRLERMVLRLAPGSIILDIVGSIESAIKTLQQHSPDLIFMDIQLSDGQSFGIFDSIIPKCPVIFTTAFDEYALQAFKANGIDYLLKPVDETQLQAALDKYYLLKGNSNFNGLQSLRPNIQDMAPQWRKRFLTGTGETLVYIATEDCALFWSEQKIVYAQLFDGSRHILDVTLELLEKELNPDQFFRANRQYIVNINTIRGLKRMLGGRMLLISTIMPPNGEQIIISRENSALLREWLDR
jgi:two-component system LytT family response regulator